MVDQESYEAKREKYWEECSSEQRVERLREVLVLMGERIARLEKFKRDMDIHFHTTEGKVGILLNDGEHPISRGRRDWVCRLISSKEERDRD